MGCESMDRRIFLNASLNTSLSALLTTTLRGGEKRRPRILLRSSWQAVNIGDIAHTPGVLTLLERYIPQADVIVWASGSLSEKIASMERRRFPGLRIVKGRINEKGVASNRELSAAIKWTDFLLHGSGPSFVAHKDVAAFVKEIGKPFGVYGITYGGAVRPQRDLLSRAKFIFFRDSVSLSKARQDRILSPVMEFGPDGAFAVDLRNDAAATRFLRRHGLQKGRYLCCIPRLRYTPYWKIHGRKMKDSERWKHKRNQKMDEHDHAPLRAAIMAVVRETGFKVLVCPEDMSQMQVGKRLLIDKLPADVRKNVVWRKSFWMPDEALSAYTRSGGLFGLEMHSPIMAVGNGVPAIVCRFAEQSSKGLMWRDIGLGDWLFDMDRPCEVARLAPTVLDLIRKPNAARERVRDAQKFVTDRQQRAMRTLLSSLPG